VATSTLVKQRGKATIIQLYALDVYKSENKLGIFLNLKPYSEGMATSTLVTQRGKACSGFRVVEMCVSPNYTVDLI